MPHIENDTIQETTSQEEVSNKSIDKPWLFKKGNPGGPGRTPGKSLKEYSREYLASLTDKERQEYLEGLPKIEIWKMAEGNPHQSQDNNIIGPVIVQWQSTSKSPTSRDIGQKDSTIPLIVGLSLSSTEEPEKQPQS